MVIYYYFAMELDRNFAEVKNRYSARLIFIHLKINCSLLAVTLIFAKNPIFKYCFVLSNVI